MNNSIAAVTTFPNSAWEVYGKAMLQSYVKFWPANIPLLVQLDNDLLFPDVDRILRPQDGIAVGQNMDHKNFIERNQGKDDVQNYRKQPVRFCHKVFALKRALDAALKQKEHEPAPRYLIWVDADVITTATPDNIIDCLPKEGDAVSYLGRKDWDHSECGWLAFDLENGGREIIEAMHKVYDDDIVLTMEQQHDSYVFDQIRVPYKCTNLTENQPGMDIWQYSPMHKWSVHHKGPVAKNKLLSANGGMIEQPIIPVPGQNFVIQTKNAIPSEEIRAHIEENQKLIKKWVKGCRKTREKIVVVSAGPLLIAEDVRAEVKKGRKIVAVKHALEPLKKAGIKPWACILLDPRPHVANFVQDADKDIIWLVASQVNPEITKKLLEKGCEIWGYHAAVGADEHDLTSKQPDSVISGGSATATRGLYLLKHLGFSDFNLYGYDLSLPDKPDLNARDEFGNPKYMEFSFSIKDGVVNIKRCFYSEPQLMAQFEELQDIIRTEKMKLKAFGDGLVPFALRYMQLSNLRKSELACNIKKTNYKRLFGWKRSKGIRLFQAWHRIYRKIHQKLKVSIRL